MVPTPGVGVGRSCCHPAGGRVWGVYRLGIVQQTAVFACSLPGCAACHLGRSEAELATDNAS
jgi:hypothetical protein